MANYEPLDAKSTSVDVDMATDKSRYLKTSLVGNKGLAHIITERLEVSINIT